MGSEDRSPDKGSVDWFKEAAARWERQKEQEKARAEGEKPAGDPAQPASPDDKPQLSASTLERLSSLSAPPAQKPLHTHEDSIVEDDLREMAANEAAAKKAREASLAPT